MADAVAVDPEKLQKRLDRATAKIDILEKMIEDKTRNLYLAQDELRANNDFMSGVLRSMQSAVIVTDAEAVIIDVQGATEALTRQPRDQLVGGRLTSLVTFDGEIGGPADLVGSSVQAELTTADGTIPVLLATSRIRDEGAGEFVMLATDVSEQRRLEVELRHAQKLESVGQLAAGVAHEINTPIQFVGDSLNFIGEAVVDALEAVGAYRSLRDGVAAGTASRDDVDALVEMEEELDIEFIEEEAPRAIERSRDGIRRVAEIVAAMKQFSHPGGSDLGPTDLNAILENTLVVAKNEYKYVAELHTELAASAEVIANPGDIGQVILNLVVNAAHAIADRIEGTDQLGRITVTTTADGGGVALTVSDTGGGVPPEIQDRIFDPFFTTKEPGRGTGQGLAIARSIVVDGHGGRLDLVVEPGVGSTFTVWLPST